MDSLIADLAFIGGTVITVDARFRLAQAAAVHKGQIIAVGEEREVRELVGPQTRVIDLKGGALLPGINDSHLHGAMLGLYAPNYWMDTTGGRDQPPRPRKLRTEAQREAALRRAWEILIPLGVTSYTEPGLGPGADRQHGGACGAAMLATYQRLAARAALPLRVNVLALYGELAGSCNTMMFMDAVGALRATPARPEARLRIAGVKIFADGTPTAQTAWMNEPYNDGSVGALLVPGEDDDMRVELLTAMVTAAHAAGLQVGVHATGSRAIDVTADAFAQATARHGARDLRHYVIHGDFASPTALAALARGGFGLNAQPAINAASAATLEVVLGRERAKQTLALPSALAAGVSVCLSSDGPLIEPDWRRGVVDAVAASDERIGLAQALRGYTTAPAWQDHAEAWKGSIEVGKVADLCVLAQNPLDIDVRELPEVPVTMTVIGGEVVYEL